MVGVTSPLASEVILLLYLQIIFLKIILYPNSGSNLRKHCGSNWIILNGVIYRRSDEKISRSLWAGNSELLNSPYSACKISSEKNPSTLCELDRLKAVTSS